MPASSAKKKAVSNKPRPDQLPCYPDVGDQVREYKGLTGISIQEIVREAMEAYGLAKRIQKAVAEKHARYEKARGDR